MKKYINKILLLFLAISATSCGDDFLEQQPSDRPTEDVLFNSVEGAQIHLNGIYSLQNYYYGEGTRGILISDVMGDDALVISSNNYSRYVGEYRYNYTVESSRAYELYYYSYRTISNANLFLNQIDNIEGDQAKINDLKAQALSLRAFAYFSLVRWFGETAYTDDPNGRGVPINTTVNSLDGYNIPRSTVGEVYQQIVSDLSEAEQNSQPADYKGFIDASAVAALQARVYLTMGDWANASKYAKKAYAGFTLIDEQTYLSGFNSTNAEVIWEQRFIDSDTNIFLSIPSFTYTSGDITFGDSNGDNVVDGNDVNASTPGADFVFGYNSLRVTEYLIELFEDTDFRKKMFPVNLDPNGNMIGDVSPDKKYAQYGAADGYLTTKYKSVSSLGTGDFPRIRAAEMYLIEAEAEANMGNTAAAQAALLKVQQRADNTVTAVTTTGQDLLDEIYVERRKELFYEGHRFFDLKRLDQNLDRTASDKDHWSDFTLTGISNDKNIIQRNSVTKRFCLPIPQDEINANEALTDEDQNEVYK
ncbi:RagB/SusD family nutrient uptake outer membrane protein [Zhouia spongiae]|uniref:RagB/SusD family nutrient uptake outer membrane protein n=1 Tax=Zhouia spongiae TaxID=2202721 RepID=A0ABY3YRH5_9FLAO|nr:RagB/SusD family nutrient uptake outer membrane protein [Zhouia spongiae]UNZ00289.1 RagB/SusD family nutrient uptake outer membrane protein [Zhouia spongiae]